MTLGELVGTTLISTGVGMTGGYVVEGIRELVQDTGFSHQTALGVSGFLATIVASNLLSYGSDGDRGY